MADLLTELVAGLPTANRLVDALLGVREVFGEDLADDTVFRALLVDHAARLLAAAS